MRTLYQESRRLLYIASKYPSMTIQELHKFMGVPPIVLDSAVWTLAEHGLAKVIEVKNDEGTVEQRLRLLGDAPVTYTEDDVDVAEVQDIIVYALHHMNGKEEDVEEHMMSQWLAGYHPGTLIIAMHQLTDNQVVATYTLHDVDKDGVDNEYIFYTLFENKDHQWGQKQFKVNPLTKEQPTESTPKEKVDPRTRVH